MLTASSNVFTYGSLMFADVWQRVVCGSYRSAPARLAGHRRICVAGECYPALVEAEGFGPVDGVVYFDVSRTDVERLDAFEGDYYERREARVSHADGSCLASFYLFREEYAQRLEDKAWDADWFQRVGKQAFLARYAGFDCMSD